MLASYRFRNQVLIFLSFIFLLGCSKDEDAITYDLVGSWRVSYYITAGDIRITKDENPTWPDVNDGEITALFGAVDGNGKGFISGITVSNSYKGTYTIGKEGTISIGPVATTLINEPEWTSLYNISAAQEFEIKNGQLFIYYNDRLNAIVFDRN